MYITCSELKNTLTHIPNSKSTISVTISVLSDLVILNLFKSLLLNSLCDKIEYKYPTNIEKQNVHTIFLGDEILILILKQSSINISKFIIM